MTVVVGVITAGELRAVVVAVLVALAVARLPAWLRAIRVWADGGSGQRSPAPERTGPIPPHGTAPGGSLSWR